MTDIRILPSVHPTRRARLAISITGVLALLVCAALAFISAVMSWLMTCDGDGGYPFSARASTAGQLCNSTAGDLYAYAQLALPILAVLVLGTFAVVRAKWNALILGVAASVTLTVIMFVVVTSLPDHCSDEQIRTLDRQECETY